MKYEDLNFGNQDKSSQDQIGEMNAMLGKESFAIHDQKAWLEKYQEKINELRQCIMELGNYVVAKEQIEKFQQSLDNIFSGHAPVVQGNTSTIMGQLQIFKVTIEKFEKDNHVPEEGGIQKIKDTIDELIADQSSLKEIQEQIKGESSRYNLN